MMIGKEKVIAEIREEILEIRSSLPAHTPRPSQLLRLEELEERLAELLDDAGEEDAAA